MRVLRIADVARSYEAGASGAMIRGGDALKALGVDVDYAFRETLGSLPTSPQARRVLAPTLALRAVIRSIRRGRIYDVVEIHEPIASAYCAARLLFDLPPCAVFSHGLEASHWEAQLDRWHRIGKPVGIKDRTAVPLTLLPQARFALRRADQVIALTCEDAEFLERRVHVDSHRISRVDNGATLVGVERLPPPVPMRLLFFGSWVDRKGVPELVDAITLLHRRAVEFELTLAGTGASEEVACSFPPDVRPRVRVQTHVSRAEVPALLAGHDIFIASSWYEGMPLTVLEAAGASMALVLTDIAGHRQILRSVGADSRQSAVLVPPHDGRALAEALSALCANLDLVLHLQRGARAIADELTWDRTAQQLRVAYEKTVAGSRLKGMRRCRIRIPKGRASGAAA